jgi:hypothetical protein
MWPGQHHNTVVRYSIRQSRVTDPAAESKFCLLWWVTATPAGAQRCHNYNSSWILAENGLPKVLMCRNFLMCHRLLLNLPVGTFWQRVSQVTPPAELNISLQYYIRYTTKTPTYSTGSPTYSTQNQNYFTWILMSNLQICMILCLQPHPTPHEWPPKCFSHCQDLPLHLPSIFFHIHLV